MNFRVIHTTEYLYSSPVGLCRNEACLLPRDTSYQNCRTSRLEIDPVPSDLRERRDCFGNRLNHFAIQQAHEKLKVTATSEVSTISLPENILELGNRFSWESVKQQLKTEKTQEVLGAFPFLCDSQMISASHQLAEFAHPSFTVERPLYDAVADLMQRIFKEFKYDPGYTTVATPISEVLESRRGVCQDFAHLAIGCLRTMGLAARYVSGYIETLPPPGQERLVGADASHAWFSVYAPSVGWIDFDPTNNKLLGEQHITVAWGRDFSDVSPLKGVALGGGKHEVNVSVDVARII